MLQLPCTPQHGKARHSAQAQDDVLRVAVSHKQGPIATLQSTWVQESGG